MLKHCRCKIIKVKSDDQKIECWENSASIRCVVSEENDSSVLYKKWIQEFVLGKYKEGLMLGHDDWENLYEFSSKESFREITTTEKFTGCSAYYFYHGHPKFKNEDIKKIEFKRTDIISHFGTIENDELSLLEFIEVVATKIDIYDNRLYGQYELLEEKHRKTLNDLNVEVWKEEKLSENNSEKNFLIIHLGFIEAQTGKKNDEAVKLFFEKKSNFTNKYDFVIITTGRGRNWREPLPSNIKRKVRDIPIENFENRFDEGGKQSLKSPAFGIKYALVKTIFGS